MMFATKETAIESALLVHAWSSLVQRLKRASTLVRELRAALMAAAEYVAQKKPMASHVARPLVHARCSQGRLPLQLKRGKRMKID